MLSRTFEVALVVVGAYVFVRGDVWAIGVWDVLAVGYLAIRIGWVRRKPAAATTNEDPDSPDWLKRLLGPRLGLWFTFLASFVGISGGLVIIIGWASDPIAKMVAVLGVLLAWAILHFGYAECYAQAYYAALPEKKILGFPDVERPTFADFSYFSFTVGSTFAVSDVETTSVIRRRVLWHGMVSFVYNTATLGIAVGVITGGK